jgi:PadR family transcriptional regulator, regulatory protein PadR
VRVTIQHESLPWVTLAWNRISSKIAINRAEQCVPGRSVDIQQIRRVYVDVQQVRTLGESKLEVLQGTLDLMILKTLQSMGPLHGYGIARRIEQVSGNALSLNQGTIYPALLRLQQRGWIKAEWGTSETGRRAKFYLLSRSGQKQIEEETANWERIAATMARFLTPSE